MTPETKAWLEYLLTIETSPDIRDRIIKRLSEFETSK